MNLRLYISKEDSENFSKSFSTKLYPKFERSTFLFVDFSINESLKDIFKIQVFYSENGFYYTKFISNEIIRHAFGKWNQLNFMLARDKNKPLTPLFIFDFPLNNSKSSYDAVFANINGNLWPAYNGGDNNGSSLYSTYGPGGGDTKFISSSCKYSPLTFTCSSSGNGFIGNNNAIRKAELDKQNIVELLAGGEDSNEYYEYSSGSFSVGETELSTNATTIVKRSDQNITITGDIMYTGGYNSLAEVPKMIVYADNIYISCTVNRIDAVLIANNVVNTCVSEESGDTPDVDNRERSRQLVINGAVIASKLEANRTYGAATGANSIVPAEIINFDPTLYLFGGNVGQDDDATGRLEVTSITEMAPRY